MILYRIVRLKFDMYVYLAQYKLIVFLDSSAILFNRQ